MVIRVQIQDGDQLEAKNTDRQHFGLDYIGESKARSAYEAVSRDLPSLVELGYSNEYADASDFAAMNSSYDLLLLAVDSDKVRRDAIENFDGWIISGQNDMRDGSTFIWHKDMNPDPKLSPIPTYIPLTDTGANRKHMSCQEIAELEGGGQLMIANFMAAAWMMAAFEQLVGDVPFRWNFVFFDTVPDNETTKGALCSWRGLKIDYSVPDHHSDLIASTV